MSFLLMLVILSSILPVAFLLHLSSCLHHSLFFNFTKQFLQVPNVLWLWASIDYFAMNSGYSNFISLLKIIYNNICNELLLFHHSPYSHNSKLWNILHTGYNETLSSKLFIVNIHVSNENIIKLELYTWNWKWNSN